MVVRVDYPGVYIDEFTPAAPIQGVGTSTVAFLGVCSYGPLMEPTLITSWDAFVATFTSGDPQTSPPEDNDYLWYAVRGFFLNGGQVCYVIAVSNAKPDKTVLKDETTPTAKDTITVTARRNGNMSPPIQVTASPEHIVPAYSSTVTSGAKLFARTVSNAVVAIGALDRATLPTADDAAQFVAGDPVVVSKTTGGGGNVQENAVVDRVSGTTVYFTTSLRNDYNPGSLIFVLAPMTQQFRAINAAKLAVGSIVTLTQQGTNPLTTVVTGVRAQRISPTLTTYAVSVKDAISGFTLGPTSDITLQSEEFSLTVAQGTTYSKTYPPMSMSQGHPSYYVSVINSDPTGLVFVKPYDGPNGPNTTALPRNRPSTSAPQNLDGGVNHDPSQITPNDYAMALHSLESHKDINIVVAADRTDQDVQQRVLTHCTSMKDRFAIFDAQKGTTLQTYNAQRAWLESDKGFAALYYPWLSVTSAKTNLPILVPPSGFVAGIYARTDSGRGVFKAPAGTEAIVSGALGVELTVSDVDQGVLNLNGVNVIRVFQRGGRPLVWGARTTTTNTNWQYVNIRRLFLYLEGSIQQGIRGAVFEPNNLELWQKLKRTISAFLTQQWRDGALFGQSEKDAFYVRIDDVLNPPDQRALGKLTVEIGVKPSYPAEFIVVRIGIWQGGSDVTE